MVGHGSIGVQCRVAGIHWGSCVFMISPGCGSSDVRVAFRVELVKRAPRPRVSHACTPRERVARTGIDAPPCGRRDPLDPHLRARAPKRPLPVHYSRPSPVTGYELGASRRWARPRTAYRRWSTDASETTVAPQPPRVAGASRKLATPWCCASSAWMRARCTPLPRPWMRRTSVKPFSMAASR